MTKATAGGTQTATSIPAVGNSMEVAPRKMAVAPRSPVRGFSASYQKPCQLASVLSLLRNAGDPSNGRRPFRGDWRVFRDGAPGPDGIPGGTCGERRRRRAGCSRSPSGKICHPAWGWNDFTGGPFLRSPEQPAFGSPLPAIHRMSIQRDEKQGMPTQPKCIRPEGPPLDGCVSFWGLTRSYRLRYH